MFSKLLHLYSVIDQAVARIGSQFADELRCGPGCADCCHAMFDISAVEAAYLASLLSPVMLEELREPAQQAKRQFQEIVAAQGTRPWPVSVVLCLAAMTPAAVIRRPMNCRTYGTPTVIQGRAHVCGLSGFDKGHSYPTINLEPLQQSLYHYSLELCGPELGNRRFAMAQVILTPKKFLVRGGKDPLPARP